MADKSLEIAIQLTAIDNMTASIRKSLGTNGNALQTFANRANAVSKKAAQIGKQTAIAGLALAAPLVLATKAAIDFEDKMSDVAKTTGLAGKDLNLYGNEILSISKNTRTSIDNLIKIGEVGGQLGVSAKELVAFTKASDQFNIALGSDYGGTEEAISQVGKVKALFRDTAGLSIASVITKTGSAINELGSVGAGTSKNINDFVLRVGALPTALKGTLANTAALGTFFEEVGIDSQIAAGGFSNFLLVASKNLPGFAQQMGLTATAAKNLLSSDSSAFASKFAASLNGLSPDVLAVKLAGLKLNSQESIKVIGALGSDTKRLTELQIVSNNAFNKGTSLAKEAAKKNETMAAKIAILKNNVSALSITTGNAFLPVLTKLVSSVTPIVDKVSSWVTKNPELTATILKVAAGVSAFLIAISGIAYTIAGITKAVSALSAVFTFLSANPIVLVIAGIVALAVAAHLIYKNWDKIKVWFSNLWTGIKAMFWKVVAWIKEWGILFIGPVGFIIKYWDNILNFFKALPSKMKVFGINMIKGLWEGIKSVIMLPMNLLTGLGKLLGFKMGGSIGVGSAPVVRKAGGQINPRSGGGGGMNYSPNVTIQGGSPTAKEDFKKILQDHSRELHSIVREQDRKSNRTVLS